MNEWVSERVSEWVSEWMKRMIFDFLLFLTPFLRHEAELNMQKEAANNNHN